MTAAASKRSGAPTAPPLSPNAVRRPIPALVGVVHLAPLPGSPGFGGAMDAVLRAAEADARTLAAAGFEALIVENYGDAPFFPERVEPVTVAALTRAALAVAAVGLPVGVNVLRNDAAAALAIAAAADLAFVRINVHVGARVTDQGVVQGRAHETLRLRRALDAEHVALLCDVHVKHSAPLGERSLVEETDDLVHRGLADAVLVTGSGTGRAAAARDLEAVADATTAPVLVASGVTPDNLGDFRRAHGVVVGSVVREGGKAGRPVEAERARAMVEAFRRR